MKNFLPQPFELKSAFQDLLLFLKNPVHGIRALPNWTWPTAVVVLLATAAAIGAVAGALFLQVGAVLRGAIIYPISSIFVIAIFSAFLYYSLLFFFRVQAQPVKVFILCFHSAIPWIIVAPFVDFLPPLSPIGIILSGMLAVVGLTDNFRIPRKSATKLVGAVVGVFLLFWMVNLIRVSKFETQDSELITPESLDIIEKELKTDEFEN